MTLCCISQVVRDVSMLGVVVALLQPCVSQAVSSESIGGRLRTTRAYWLQDAYASDVVPAIRHLLNSDMISQGEKPAIIVADETNNVLIVDVPAADVAKVDRAIRKLDARPEIVWLHSELSRETPGGCVVLSRPVLSCQVGYGESTATVGPEGDKPAEKFVVHAKVSNFDRQRIDVDATLVFEQTSVGPTGSHETTSRSIRIFRTLLVGETTQVLLPCDSNQKDVVKLKFLVRNSSERSGH